MSKQLQCDQCGATATVPGWGWYHVEQSRSARTVRRVHAYIPDYKEQWDFCSIACLHKWAGREES